MNGRRARQAGPGPRSPADAGLGRLLQQATKLRREGRLAQALAIAERVLKLAPSHVEALTLAGALQRQSGKLQEAVQTFERLGRLHPMRPNGPLELGRTLRTLGRFDEALSSVAAAQQRLPGDAALLVELGECRMALNRLAAAEADFRAAIALQPGNAAAHFQLGYACYYQRKLEPAREAFSAACAADPGLVRAHWSLGAVLRDLGRLQEAMACYERALAIDPKDAWLHVRIGKAQAAMGRHEQAVMSLRRAVDLSPRSPDIYSNYLWALCQSPVVPPEEVFAEHRRFGEIFGSTTAIAPHGNARDPEKRLRVGYVSGDFCRHAVANFIRPVLENHDPQHFEVFCYPNVYRPDEITKGLKALAPNWRSVVGLSDQTVARMVREDGIDILVDLSGHTALNRLPVFALKPAPVQVSWLGYPNTTGLKEIDYRLVGRFAASPDLARLFVEKLFPMPSASACYEIEEDAPDPAPLPALIRKHVTFGCYNDPSKLNESVIRLWSQLLQRLPDSRIILKYRGMDDPTLAGSILSMFAAHGVAAHRVDMKGASPFREYLQAYGDVDIALDPFPYTGGTTTRNALWMGVPVVTLRGQSFVQRSPGALLAAGGLDFCVATSEQDYIDIALALAGDLGRLAELRATLRDRLRDSAAFNPQRLTRDLEAAFRSMWITWCAA